VWQTSKEYAEPYPFGCCCEQVALQSEVFAQPLMQQYAAAQSGFLAQSPSLAAHDAALHVLQSGVPGHALDAPDASVAVPASGALASSDVPPEP
jgi:hypothetical protein